MKVSVAMCTYNGHQYIKEQLLSILEQTIPIDEIIICDDGSKDATIQIIIEYMNAYPGVIKLIKDIPKILKRPYACVQAILFFLLIKMIYGFLIKCK